MPAKDYKEYHKAYRADPEHKARQKVTKKEFQERRKLWWRELKNKPCTDCNVSYPYFVMEWHHILPRIEKLPGGGGARTMSKGRILAELKRCVLLCANCHRLRHNGQMSLGIVGSG